MNDQWGLAIYFHHLITNASGVRCLTLYLRRPDIDNLLCVVTHVLYVFCAFTLLYSTVYGKGNGEPLIANGLLINLSVFN